MKGYIVVENRDNQYSIEFDDNIAEDIFKVIINAKLFRRGEIRQCDYKKILSSLAEQNWGMDDD